MATSIIELINTSALRQCLEMHISEKRVFGLSRSRNGNKSSETRPSQASATCTRIPSRTAQHLICPTSIRDHVCQHENVEDVLWRTIAFRIGAGNSHCRQYHSSASEGRALVRHVQHIIGGTRDGFTVSVCRTCWGFSQDILNIF